MKTILLNYHNFHSTKQNKDYTVIQILRDLTKNEVSNGYFGSQVSEEIFMPDAFVNFFKPEYIGKELALNYEVIGGKANLVDIKIL